MQMRSIYSSASETIIYLGDDDGSKTNLSAWNYLERNSRWAMDNKHKTDYKLPMMREKEVDFRGDLSDVEHSVLSQSWFQRVWVFQEVVVSRRLSIQCGDRRVSWDDFCKILLLSPRYHDGYGFSLEWQNKIDKVIDMFHARCKYHESISSGEVLPTWRSQVPDYKGGGQSILELLERARDLHSSDPKDKIYALLGIASGVVLEDPRIAVNYGRPLAGVYIDFSTFMMHLTSSYDMLSCLARGLLNCRMEDPDFVSVSNGYENISTKILLPSWVPNWGGSAKQAGYNGSTRTFLSTVDADDEITHLLRQAMIFHDRLWYGQWGDEHFICSGTIVGEISYQSLDIKITGLDETCFQTFQTARDKLFTKNPFLPSEILNLWKRNSPQIMRMVFITTHSTLRRNTGAKLHSND